MLYISRKTAVLDRENGVVLWNIPNDVAVARTYQELRTNLSSYAWMREQSERIRQSVRGGAGRVRAHYRCILSFERDTSTEIVRRLVTDWFKSTFAHAGACAFVHRDTDNLHVHVWIDARGTDGKKLDFSAQKWRRIGESWERLYIREMERQDRLEMRFEKSLLDRANEERGTERTTRRGIDLGQTPAPKMPQATQRESPSVECAQSRKRTLRELDRLLTEVTGLPRERLNYERE